ncbi:MAG: ribbon-helix-helix domain-containing protein [Patescibacteria group bacterium]
MSNGTAPARERVNITLPEDTLRLIDRVTRKTNRSGFVERAVRFYIAETGQENLRKQLRANAKEHFARDRTIAEDWFPVEPGA